MGSKMKETILKLIKDNNKAKIVLYGDSGIGKTWMAREIFDFVIKEDVCYATLWVSMNINYDTKSLQESIAIQLGLLPMNEEWEEDCITIEDEKDKDKEKDLKQRIREKLDEKRVVAHEEKKSLLLIFDDEGAKMKLEDVWKELQDVIPSNPKNPLKILITKVTSEDQDTGATNLEIKRLSEEESEKLLGKKVDQQVLHSDYYPQLSTAIKPKGIPGIVNVISGTLNYISRRKNSEFGNLDIAITQVTEVAKTSDNLIPVLQWGRKMLPQGVMIDCFWQSRLLFEKWSGVHFNELITHWILEGYFDPVNDISKIYNEGHRILLDFLDLGLLKIQEGNIVVVEGANVELIDHRAGGFGKSASLGLSAVLEGSKWRGLGKIVSADGMIKSLPVGKTPHQLSAILIDGHRLRCENPEVFFQKKEEMEVLAILNARLESLPTSFLGMKKLVVLVIRSCGLLKQVNGIKRFSKLIALEISAVASLENFPMDFFGEMNSLRSLNVSDLQIEELPSLANLTELRWLLIRKCPKLAKMHSIAMLKNLEMLDFAGATSLTKLPDGSINTLAKLQILDLSETKIVGLPILYKLTRMTRLILRGCKFLTKLRNFSQLVSLAMIDLADSIEIKGIHDACLENNVIVKYVDLSGTRVKTFPTTIMNLTHLKLRNCLDLEEFPSTTQLTGLELIDVSNSTSLIRVKDESFEHLKNLWWLDFTNTDIKILPSVSGLVNLQHLLLKGCKSLEKLPKTTGLKSLRVLDLSGCVKVVDVLQWDEVCNLEVLDISYCGGLQVETKEFNYVSHLRIINLDESGASSFGTKVIKFLDHMTGLKILKVFGSNIEVQSFSNISKLVNLTQLSLKRCSGLKSLPPLTTLSNLEILDLSETEIGSQISLEKLSKLRELYLRNCSSLQHLQHIKSVVHLEILDLWGTKITEIPLEMSEIVNIKQLNLPKASQLVNWSKKIRLPEELNWGEFSVSGPDEISGNNEKCPVMVSGSGFFQLETNSDTWEKVSEKFYLSVSLLEKQGNESGIFNNVYFKARYFSGRKENGRCLEIHGSFVPDKLPKGLHFALGSSEYLYLIENTAESCSSVIGSNGVQLKGFWLEKCCNIKIIFSEINTRMEEKLEFLYISSLPKLEMLCMEVTRSDILKLLKHLHLDCCTKIKTVFPISLLPENLEVLRIKFCDNLETVFQCNKSENVVLKTLRVVYLLELPELVTFGVKLSPTCKFDKRECSKLQDTEESLKQ